MLFFPIQFEPDIVLETYGDLILLFTIPVTWLLVSFCMGWFEMIYELEYCFVLLGAILVYIHV